MSTIADIRALRGVMIVSTDDGQSLRVRVADFKKMPVESGDEIDFDAYSDRLAAIQLPVAYEAALGMLDFSAKTRRELERALISKGFVPNCVAAALDRLEEIRLLDDAALAARYAENAVSKPVGIYALKRKLRAKGVTDEDAESALACLDDRQQAAAARAAAEKLSRKYASLPCREARAKLSQALARRGFAWDAAQTAVEAVIGDDFDNENT